MSRQANGQYLQPANTAAVSGQTISSTAFNTLITDIGTEITNSLDRGGRSAMTAPLPMGGQKITGMADPTVSTDAVTKNYADAAIAAFFSTGDMKLTLKTVADSGWVLATSPVFGNGTIGSASSSATLRANADCQALFTLIFNNLSDTNAPITTSAGAATTRAAQSSASAAWAANCRMSLGFYADRALAIAGNPADLPTNRNLGDRTGAETSTLVTGNLPAYTPSGTVAGTVSSLTLEARSASTSGGNAANTISQGNGGGTALGGQNVQIDGSSISATFTGAPQGGTSTPVSIMQPTTYVNVMIKL